MSNAYPRIPTISRRTLLGAATAGAITLPLGLGAVVRARQTPAVREELVIDLSGTPESIDPALAYAPRDWSIVHSIYDAPIGFDASGTLVPLAAESFTAPDDRTFEMTLGQGLTFHDGSPVDAAAVRRSVAYLQGSDSLAVDLFNGITGVEEVDGLTARILCDAPSPWLPAQMAVWMLLLPEGFTAEQAATAPVGSGPYRFVSMAAGQEIVVERNEAYTWPSPKGGPLADRVRFRFVPETGTRIADLASGLAQIVTDLPADQLASVEEAGQQAVDTPIVGSAWIRIATDAAPFDDVRVRRALNHAVDAQAIATSLVSGDAGRLANLYPDERAMGFDPALAPYRYDPDLARSLLAEAGYGDGFATELEMTTTSRTDVAQAIIAQLAEIAVEVTIVTSDDATFNAGWADPKRPPLRMSTWIPLFDPHTLLSLVYASEGFLSRYANDNVDALIGRGASEADPVSRAATYRELGKLMHEDAPAIFLWNLTAGYGVASDLQGWQPRGDEYVIPTAAGGPES